MTDTAPDSKPGGSSLADSLVGQAAAGITLAAALIYGAGALTIALRLYFTHLPWASIVGQMPHDLIITTGFGQVMLPAVIIGVLGAILLNFLINEDHPNELRRRRSGFLLASWYRPEGTRRTIAGWLQSKLRHYLQARPGVAHFAAWLGASAILGAAAAGIALPDYLYHQSGYLHPSVVISWPNFFLVVGVASGVAAGIALIMLPQPRPLTAQDATPAGQPHDPAAPATTDVSPARPTKESKPPPKESKLSSWQWQAFVGMLIAFAAIPGVAAISASTLFPLTLACSPAFHDGRLSGNLIATNGGWAYMVEYRQSNFSHDYFSVVPLSSVRLMAIGQYSDCNTLATTPTATPTARPSASP